jgi:2-dehydro-3-deoxyphosphogluconate aldolase / (4S)-4-hydroxy-2-oxoglutarate aldolase
MSNQAAAIDHLLGSTRVMPVVVIDDAEKAVPLAEALLEGGISAIEITLRTDAALDAVRRIKGSLPDMVVGTGTVLSPTHLKQSLDAGAVFAVSPGLTPRLAEAAITLIDDIPLLPGTAGASDVMAAMEFGFERLKFFPAEAAGGLPMIKSLASPLQAAKFCPTGGISEKTAPDYLAQANVFCVGGSWLTPKAAIADGDWAEITRIAKAATAI